MKTNKKYVLCTLLGLAVGAGSEYVYHEGNYGDRREGFKRERRTRGDMAEQEIKVTWKDSVYFRQRNGLEVKIKLIPDFNKGGKDEIVLKYGEKEQYLVRLDGDKEVEGYKIKTAKIITKTE